MCKNNQQLEPFSFSNTYLGHLFDRFFYKKAEDEFLSENLVDNFQTLVSRLLAKTENFITI